VIAVFLTEKINRIFRTISIRTYATDCLTRNKLGDNVPIPVGIFFSSPKSRDRLWFLPSLPFNRYRGYFPTPPRGIKAGHSPSPSAEVKNEWSCSSIPICLQGAHRDTPLPLPHNCGVFFTERAAGLQHTDHFWRQD